MITTKVELERFIQEDRKVNAYKDDFISSIIACLCKTEGYVICRYLYELRFCEYLRGKKGLFNRLRHKIHAMKKSRIGTKYNIYIPEGITGYGLRICHLSGGGVFY